MDKPFRVYGHIFLSTDQRSSAAALVWVALSFFIPLTVSLLTLPSFPPCVSSSLPAFSPSAFSFLVSAAGFPGLTREKNIKKKPPQAWGKDVKFR